MPTWSAAVSVAIVHDFLSQCGGAERVVLQLAAMFPDAPIYTSFYAPERTFAEFADRDVRTSRLQGRIDPDGFRWAVLRYPGAFRSFDLSAFDTVVVSSSAFAHHVVHERSFVYCHTPPRFLYESGAYRHGRKLRLLARPALAVLRGSDRRAVSRHRSYAANSEVTAERVRRLYGREAAVLHPPLWTRHLPAEPPPFPRSPRALLVSRLLKYKRVDVAVEACRLVGMPLTVVGDGPERRRLEENRWPGVAFLGRVDDIDLAPLFAEHSVALVPAREDFGYGAVEANYAGRPVVALAAGGARETVVHGVTGLLVESYEPAAWALALGAVHEREWSPGDLRRATTRFQAPRFDAAVRRWLGLGDVAVVP